jgi:hypothetical protein
MGIFRSGRENLGVCAGVLQQPSAQFCCPSCIPSLRSVDRLVPWDTQAALDPW